MTGVRNAKYESARRSRRAYHALQGGLHTRLPWLPVVRRPYKSRAALPSVVTMPTGIPAAGRLRAIHPLPILQPD